MPDALQVNQVRTFTYADFEAMGYKIRDEETGHSGAVIHKFLEMSKDAVLSDTLVDSFDLLDLCDDFESELQRMPQFQNGIRFPDSKITEVRTKWDFYLMICSACEFTPHE